MLTWKRSVGALCALALLSALAAPAALAADAPGDIPDDAVTLTLSGDAAALDGEPVPEDDPTAAVYTAHDIVYYEAGHDFTYGEGTAADEHSAQEAQAHTVVHITQPGAYILQGTLDPGQIAVDLGEDAKEDPDAVVVLVLDGVSVTCTVAPAVIFYNVYECDQTGDQGYEPDLSGAGARVIVADGSENAVSGSYVARIYKSYTLSEDGKSVADSKKLHKYDGAFYSKMSMTVDGGPACTGQLRIDAENEGLDTEMHLAINGGVIRIASGNDGINCNEDGVSVVTVNGGETHITVTGGTGEGDGIDSNGWLVLNAGTVTAQACSTSADAGLDAENGIYLNGGLVIATGSMLDPVTSSDQCGAVFTFARPQTGGVRYALSGADGTEYIAFTPENSFSILLLSGPALSEDAQYTLSADGDAVAVSASAGAWGMGGGRGGMPGGFGPAVGQQPPELTDGTQPGDAPEPPDGTQSAGASEPPDGAQSADAPEPPDGAQPDGAPEPPDGTQPDGAPEPPDGAQPGDAPELPDSAQPDGAPEPPDGAAAAETFSLSPGLNYFRAG